MVWFYRPEQPAEPVFQARPLIFLSCQIPDFAVLLITLIERVHIGPAVHRINISTVEGAQAELRIAAFVRD